jgi:arylsulfatase A-like enzyme
MDRAVRVSSPLRASLARFVIACSAGLVATCIPAQPALAQEAAAPADGRPYFEFRTAALDGVDRLVIRGDACAIEHLEWQPMAAPVWKIHGKVPREGDWRLEVRRPQGRAVVTVEQQPSAANHWETRVRLDDGGPAGAAPLEFELVLVEARHAPHPRNVLLITIDSLRPDRLGCYGHPRATSPTLDRLALASVRYTNAFSTSSFTPPSHASLLTSRYVGDHGLLTWESLDGEQLTLPEVLSDYGYRTGAAVNLQLLTAHGLGQGVAWQRDHDRDARAIVSDAIEFLATAGDAPWFLWLHLYDVHRPYAREPGFAERFAGRRVADAADEESYNLTPEQRRRRKVSDEQLRDVVDRYDAGIASTDAELAPLLARLEDPRRLADTLVIVTADHGESLLDHDERYFSHDPFLYSAVTRIPLLIRYPGGAGAGTVSEELTGLLDLAPTVLDQLGIEPPDAFRGMPLRPAAAPVAGGAATRDHLFMECWGWEELKAVRDRRYLLILDMKTKRARAFDLQHDPGEVHPLAVVPDAAHDLLEALTGFAARRRARESPGELDDATLQRLRALGYGR